ncbi:MAG: molecular chaperone HscC [Hyphomicrobium sp.]|uniref:Hsp70 family protein n=1 Tax=Hyphomicrobium sp. TaxID=82 RepID=UPI0039E3A2A6
MHCLDRYQQPEGRRSEGFAKNLRGQTALIGFLCDPKRTLGQGSTSTRLSPSICPLKPGAAGYNSADPMTSCGIDLGTTNSLISVLIDGVPTLVPNALGKVLTPSAVGVSDDGKIIVGQAAKERLITHPADTTASFKRYMGSSHATSLGRFSFRPEELSAFVLRALKADADAFLGGAIEHAVISVPAYFNDHQRKATIDAGRLAGLKVDRLVNEPTAAALAYGFGDVPEGKYLVFDLGGGTFDVSILDKYEGVIEIRATTGDTRLGGEDFTNIVEMMIATENKLDIKVLTREERARLTRVSETLKVNLSTSHTASYSLQLNQALIEGEIARASYEQECMSLLRRLRGPTERALVDAKMVPSEFDAVVLVGGATRSPMVRSLVGRLFQKLPLVNIDPDTTVALGAATQAGLVGRDAGLRDVVMTDVSPYTLGIALLDWNTTKNIGERSKYVSPVIHRNAIVPISRSIVICTAVDNQTYVEVEVYQGENLRPESNVFLGSFKVAVPPKPKGQESIAVRFTYDINGALEVEATVVSTKAIISKVFRNASGLSEEELIARFKSLSTMKLLPRDEQENKTLLARAERLYAEQNGTNREILRTLIANFEKAIDDQTQREFRKVRDWFSAQLDAFETSPFWDS